MRSSEVEIKDSKLTFNSLHNNPLQNTDLVYLTSEAFTPVKTVAMDENDFKKIYGKEKVISTCTEEKDKKVNVSENKSFFSQISTLIDAYIAWGDGGKFNDPARNQYFQNFKQLFPGYAETQPASYSICVKKGLEEFLFKLYDERIPLEKRGITYYRLCVHLSVCAPGVNMHIQEVNMSLNLQETVEWWLAELRNELVSQYSELHSAAKEVAEENIAHVYIAFVKEAFAQGWNPLFNADSIKDNFKIHAKVKVEDLKAFREYFCKNYTMDTIFEKIQAKLEDRIMQLTIKYALTKKTNNYLSYNAEFVKEFESFLKSLGLTHIDEEELNAIAIFTMDTGDHSVQVKLNEIVNELIRQKKLFTLFLPKPNATLVEEFSKLLQTLSLPTVELFLKRYSPFFKKLFKAMHYDGDLFAKALLLIKDDILWQDKVGILKKWVAKLGETGCTLSSIYQYEKVLKAFPHKEWYEIDRLMNGYVLETAVQTGDLDKMKLFFENTKGFSFELLQNRVDFFLGTALQNVQLNVAIYILKQSTQNDVLLKTIFDFPFAGYILFSNEKYQELLKIEINKKIHCKESAEFQQLAPYFLQFCNKIIGELEEYGHLDAIHKQIYNKIMVRKEEIILQLGSSNTKIKENPSSLVEEKKSFRVNMQPISLSSLFSTNTGSVQVIKEESKKYHFSQLNSSFFNEVEKEVWLKKCNSIPAGRGSLVCFESARKTAKIKCISLEMDPKTGEQKLIGKVGNEYLDWVIEAIRLAGYLKINSGFDCFELILRIGNFHVLLKYLAEIDCFSLIGQNIYSAYDANQKAEALLVTQITNRLQILFGKECRLTADRHSNLLEIPGATNMELKEFEQKLKDLNVRLFSYPNTEDAHGKINFVGYFELHGLLKDILSKLEPITLSSSMTTVKPRL